MLAALLVLAGYYVGGLLLAAIVFTILAAYEYKFRKEDIERYNQEIEQYRNEINRLTKRLTGRESE